MFGVNIDFCNQGKASHSVKWHFFVMNMKRSEGAQGKQVKLFKGEKNAVKITRFTCLRISFSVHIVLFNSIEDLLFTGISLEPNYTVGANLRIYLCISCGGFC